MRIGLLIFLLFAMGTFAFAEEAVLPTAATVAAAPTQTQASADPSELFSKAQASYIEHDYASAADLFKKAADGGHAEAQYMYGLMLYRGEGMTAGVPNYQESARYYTLAAEQGLSKAQYNLSVLYYQGSGVARDDVQSYKWLYLSSQQKEPRALKMIPVAERNVSADLKAQALADITKLSQETKVR